MGKGGQTKSSKMRRAAAPAPAASPSLGTAVSSTAGRGCVSTASCSSRTSATRPAATLLSDAASRPSAAAPPPAAAFSAAQGLANCAEIAAMLHLRIEQAHRQFMSAWSVALLEVAGVSSAFTVLVLEYVHQFCIDSIMLSTFCNYLTTFTDAIETFR
jgi:hypothetical protein